MSHKNVKIGQLYKRAKSNIYFPYLDGDIVMVIYKNKNDIGYISSKRKSVFCIDIHTFLILYKGLNNV